MASLLHARQPHAMLPAMDNASVPAKALGGHVTISSAQVLAVHSANVLRVSDRARSKDCENLTREGEQEVESILCTIISARLQMKRQRSRPNLLDV